MIDEEQLIPHAEELEWLETNSFLSEYENEESFHFDEEETGEDDGDLLPSAILLPADPDKDHVIRKRVWSEVNHDITIIDGISRGEESIRKKIAVQIVEDEEDKDCSLYSSQPQKVSDASENDHLMSDISVQEKKLSKFAVDIDGDCVPVTGPSGDRVYAKIQLGKIAGDGLKELRKQMPKNGLLSEPIDIMIKKLDQEAFAKAFEENDSLPCYSTHSEVPTFREKLWVEKYAPSSFTELLSDEQTNREVLLWLKQWDSSVFGSQIRLTTEDVFSSLRHHSSTVQSKSFFSSTAFSGKGRGAHSSYQNHAHSSYQNHAHSSYQNHAQHIQSENINVFSECGSKKSTVDHPPEQKILLLCGPPGLGKTTLAHVAAKHCGYRVVEINASDDRSSSVLESKIIDAVQMASVTLDLKPKCLIIDEIDGALGEGKGAVEVILKMVAADKKANTEKHDSSQSSLSEKLPSKRGRKSATLLRPVICICNDLYAPALRPLRQIAKIHMFVQPTISRVVNRLKYICKKEELRTNSIALAVLADYTECDIRSCLNTLQFLNKKKEALNILEVGSQVVGHKDISRSCFDIWKKIFQKGKSKRENSSANSLKGHGDFEFMYSLLSGRGDYDLTMDGIHENFLKLSYIDPMMTKTVACLDTLGVSDRVHQFIMRTQQMALYAYQPPLAITISRLIALVDKPNIEWPKSQQRCRALTVERKDLLKLWLSRILPIISRHLSTENFAEDFVSFFLHILAPPTLRPVALHLLSEKEKDAVAQLVDTMVSYSVTYKSSKTEHLKGPLYYGTPTDLPVLTLDPPLGDIINFKDHQPEFVGLTLAIKQILLHEVEKHRILRENSGRSLNLNDDEYNKDCQASNIRNSEASHMIPASIEASNKPRLAAMIKSRNENENRISISNVKKATSSTATIPGVTGNKKKLSSSTNFFDRFRQGNSNGSKDNAGSLQKAATAKRDSMPFLFKYNEGFTNAVKRWVKVRELLL